MEVKNTLKVTSSAFENGSLIPSRYTCDGENINPDLEISGVPQEAKSLVLIVDDPDAPMGTFSHWLVWNISPSVGKIAENSMPEDAVVGRNDFGENSYGGPCPPSGEHRYFFKVYTLDTVLELDPSVGRKELLRAIDGHILAKGELMGRYLKNKVK